MPAGVVAVSNSIVLAISLVQVGIALGVVGGLSLLRPLRFLRINTRRQALALVVLAIGCGLVGALLPAPLLTATARSTRLDQIVPAWQFSERHSTRVFASPQSVMWAIRQTTAREITLFRFLTWLRNLLHWPGAEQPESILAAPADQPILSVALRSGFMLLAEEPDELVFGTLVLVPAEIRRLPAAEREKLRAAFDPEKFARLASPGYAKAVMNFRLAERGAGWTDLTTETRVYATDAASARRFAAYWRVIYPGSSLIRRNWLAAIRARAESID